MTLPGRGLTVLEASAGTGKTHRATSIALEAVAAGIPARQLLLVTFTRAATSELRDKVWHRLADAESSLGANLADPGRIPADPVVAALVGEPDATVLHHRRVARALADFDGATIATIHGFCEQVLARVGFAGDVERDVDFVEDIRPLVEEVVDDLLVQKLDRSAAADFDRGQARAIAERVLANPGARIVPDPPTTDRATMYTGFARVVRQRLEDRKRARRLIGYDDLLARLADALAGPNGGLVRRWLRATFELVVVDEFQDTDGIQWDILRRAFVETPGDESDDDPDDRPPPSRLVVVGDPKQAIYAFRGADVHAYLQARRGATLLHLDENWRSDADLLGAVDVLFDGAELGHPEIRYRGSHAAPHLQEPRLVGGLKCEPLRLRVLTRSDEGAIWTERSGDLRQSWAVSHVARDLASDVVHRLAGSRGRVAQLIERDRNGEETHRRPVRPGDLAVLVRTNRDADVVQDALAGAGVPAVVNGTSSVFATDAASQWRELLEAVEQPTSPTRVRSAALGPFLGWSATDLVLRDEVEGDRLLSRLHRWRRTLNERGVAAMEAHLAADTGYRVRLLRTLGGERALTDLRHLLELLHTHEQSHDGGAANLVSWLDRQIATAGEDGDDVHQNRRLESDDDAVQVWTIHRSKGLEFPIVYLPYLWKPPWRPDSGFPAVFHDETGNRNIHVALDDAGHTEAERAHGREEDGEELRLAYVGFTRARSQVVAWWAPATGAADAPLGQLLLPDLDRRHGRWRTPTPPDHQVALALEDRRRRAGGAIRVEAATGGDGSRWSRERHARALVGPARFGRPLDRTWRRTSYSALTELAYHVSHPPDHGDELGTQETGDPPGWAVGRAGDLSAPEHDDRGLEDERMGEPGERAPTDAPPADPRRLDPHPPPPGVPGDEDTALGSLPVVLDQVGAGAAFGTLVHQVLEHVDFAAPDLEAALVDALEQALGPRGGPSPSPGAADPGAREILVSGLAAAIRTPLGPMVGDVSLRDVGRDDRLDELRFEFPLAGGDRPGGHVTMHAIADVIADHLPPHDPVAATAASLRRPELAARVRGYLSGAIDVVARIDGHFVVIDHKSNRLAPPGEELSAWHYRPDALAEAMVRAHYPLQALLYQVAVHRYLRWRLPGYDPATHLGGVLYLFLRGMTGPEVPRVSGAPCGVFAWHPPIELVVALSELLATGDRDQGPS